MTKNSKIRINVWCSKSLLEQFGKMCKISHESKLNTVFSFYHMWWSSKEFVFECQAAQQSTFLYALNLYTRENIKKNCCLSPDVTEKFLHFLSIKIMKKKTKILFYLNFQKSVIE